MGQRPGWGQLDGGIEKRDPLPHPQMKRSRAFIALKPQRPAFKGEDENSGVGVSSLSSGNETWPVAGVEKPCISKLLTSPVPRSVCTDTHTHTDLICFPSPCGDWNIHISHKPTHTFSNCWIFLHKVPHASSHTSLFLPAHRNELKGRVSVVWLKRALSAAFPISHSCVKAFFSSSPSLFFLFLAVERRKER